MNIINGVTAKTKSDADSTRPVRLNPKLVRLLRWIGAETGETLGEVADRLLLPLAETEYNAVLDRQLAARSRAAGTTAVASPATPEPIPTLLCAQLQEVRDDIEDEVEPFAVNTSAPPIPKLSREEIAARKPKLIEEARALRKQNLSFQKIGDRLGVSPATVQNYLRGR